MNLRVGMVLKNQLGIIAFLASQRFRYINIYINDLLPSSHSHSYCLTCVWILD